MRSEELIFSVSDFVGVFNQTVQYAYPTVAIVGELANFRVSKNRWVYFDLKDEHASVRFFGTVYMLPGPLEDGMLMKVVGSPQLHPQFGFSITVQNMQLAGEGTIKKAAQLLEAKLQKEGLFDESRKRPVPYPPQSVGLITSGESAAYGDFMKILNARWGGVEISHYDVQVQGESAPGQIVSAIEQCNAQAKTPEVLVIIRGGGSADDLQVFSDERVVRAVAASRVPTVVAIGHEMDISLAELAADKRASTPSNAAELLVPDKKSEQAALTDKKNVLQQQVEGAINRQREGLQNIFVQITRDVTQLLSDAFAGIDNYKRLLAIMNPEHMFKHGYIVAYKNNKIINSIKSLNVGDEISLRFKDGQAQAEVKKTANKN